MATLTATLVITFEQIYSGGARGSSSVVDRSKKGHEMPNMPFRTRRPKWGHGALALAMLGALVGAAAWLAHSRSPAPTVAAVSVAVAVSAPASSHAGHVDVDDHVGSDWTALTDQERSTLGPLRARWASLDASTRSRWIEVADHLQGKSMPALVRAQHRMASWQRLTPQQRASARAGYALSARLSPKERHRQWLAYESSLLKTEPAQRAPSTTAAPSVSATAPCLSTTLVSLPDPGDPHGVSARTAPELGGVQSAVNGCNSS
jgi:hypothetical protein